MVRQRRLVQAGLVGLAASALVLTSCSSGGEGGGGNDGPAIEAANGGEAIYAIDTPLLLLDPNASPAAQDARVMRQAFDNLVAFDDDRELVPWLATEWSVSDDGLEYTFKLRDDVTFWDDTPFNAESVCFNLDRIKDPATGSRYAVSLIGPYESCSTTDEFTAVVKMSAKYSPFMSILTSPFLGMVSPTAAAAVAPADFGIAPVGSGPFIIEKYTPADSVEMVVNEDYNWPAGNATHEGRAYLDKLTYQIVPDSTVRLGSLRSGAFQAIGNVPETEAKSIEDDATLNFFAQSQSGSPFQLHLNADRAPFDDPEVRNAIRTGFDIDSAVSALYLGVYERAWGPLSPTTGSYDKGVEGSSEFDPDAAAKALDKAGWEVGSDGIREKDGEKLEILYVEATPNREKRQDIAEFFKANMKDIGVSVEIKLGQVAEITQISQDGTYDILGLSLVNVDPNVLDSIYSPQFIPEPGRSAFNFSHTRDDALAQLLIDGQEEQDQAARDEIYADVQKNVIDNARSIAVYVPTYTMASNGIQGIRFDAEGYPVWYDVSMAQ